jgi:hypothetical protein
MKDAPGWRKIHHFAAKGDHFKILIISNIEPNINWHVLCHIESEFESI